MKKHITVLVIDDVNQNTNIRALKASLNKKFELEVIPIVTNSVELRKEGSDHLDEAKLFDYIEKTIANRKIDWALTDFNLAETYIDGLQVVDKLNSLRRNIKIILYSGDQTDVIKRILGIDSVRSANDNDIVDAVRKLLGYNIVDFVKRDDYRQEFIKQVNREDDNPTVKDFLVTQLRIHADMEFKSCFEKLKGKTFGEIADMIEQNSDQRTDQWTRELVEQAMAYLVKINE